MCVRVCDSQRILGAFFVSEVDVELGLTVHLYDSRVSSPRSQIFAFFESAHDGLSEGQFYAILRLVAHAQNGRTITRDLVFIERE